MSEEQPDEKKDIRATIYRLHWVSLIVPVVIFAAFIALGIAVQNWAIVVIFTILGLAAIATSIAIKRNR